MKLVHRQLVSIIHWRNRQNAHGRVILVGERIKPPPTNAELRAQFMSDEALALKRETPMFTK